MNKDGPIIVIEDDADDRAILEEVFNKLNYSNKLMFFSEGEEALNYLIKHKGVHPFLILADINMPKMNGFELRKKVFSDIQLHKRCIPYLFFTTSASKKGVEDAYAMSVQGFFLKPNSMSGLEDTIRKIMEYWKESIAPADID